MSSRPRLYLIDGLSNAFRAFYAIRELSTSQGEPTNAVYGFVQMLRKLLREENPELVGVAWDVSDVTVRTERYADYKANRAPMPEGLRAQLPRIREALGAFRIPVVELAGYEADDVLGTLARQGAAQGYDVVLVSADKDLMQLVAPGIAVFHTGRNRLYDEAAVEAEWGVPPARVADVLALQGDSVDNVPGVPGIGEKGARQLIAEHGSLEALLANAAAVKRKAYREGLEQHREQALLSKELVTIHTELPLTLDVAALRHEPPDTAALRALYGALEFETLLAELGPEATVESEAIPAARELTSPDELATLLAAAGAELAVARLGEEEPVALAFAVPGEEPRYVDLRRDEMREAAAARLGTLAADPDGSLVGHDLKEVLRLLPPESERPAAALWDTMLVSYLLRASVHGHGLSELARERLGYEPLSAREAGWERGAQPPVGDERLARAAGEAAVLPLRLLEPLRDELGTGALARVYREIEAPLLPVLLAMENAGIALDGELLRTMSGEMEGELGALEREAHALAGEPFNLNSPRQLGEILFEKLGYPAGRRTQKTKRWSTDADTLAALAAKGFPLPEVLLRYRELAKLKSTYVDALPALCDAEGRVHTRFQQAVAATGRLSSTNPNLQNIPVRTELGRRIRRAFRAAPGAVLVAADYSQIELRVLAHIAAEPELIAAFQRGEDIHRTTAASVFGVVPELVTSDQRRAAKTINFGLIYGMSAFGLAQNLGVETREAERFIAAYFARFSRVQEYMRETLATAEREGRVETLAGRIRWLPEIHSKSWNLRENARRMAINARIQGTAADILKRAMIAVDRRLRTEQPEARLLLTVHDELVLEAPAAAAAATAALVRTEMEGAERLAVPLVAETGWGDNWMAAKD
ncbi:MAG TPA: DNA polymerase I [Thermoanaerobaculia bacterium]|jgi:DNA polymerase-1|nr:MAG: DNA polymerase I [Acidobacteria bacterium ADurb.Bin051]HQN39666.1 DNA polymerase I [Thermoanaerobaculia bacterium]